MLSAKLSTSLFVCTPLGPALNFSNSSVLKLVPWRSDCISTFSETQRRPSSPRSRRDSDPQALPRTLAPIREDMSGLPGLRLAKRANGDRRLIFGVEAITDRHSGGLAPGQAEAATYQGPTRKAAAFARADPLPRSAEVFDITSLAQVSAVTLRQNSQACNPTNDPLVAACCRRIRRPLAAAMLQLQGVCLRPFCAELV